MNNASGLWCKNADPSRYDRRKTSSCFHRSCRHHGCRCRIRRMGFGIVRARDSCRRGLTIPQASRKSWRRCLIALLCHPYSAQHTAGDANSAPAPPDSVVLRWGSFFVVRPGKCSQPRPRHHPGISLPSIFPRSTANLSFPCRRVRVRVSESRPMRTPAGVHHAPGAHRCFATALRFPCRRQAVKQNRVRGDVQPQRRTAQPARSAGRCLIHPFDGGTLWNGSPGQHL
jgi:hypothetical protein